MALCKAICPNCDTVIDVEQSDSVASCPHCSLEMTIPDAIKAYMDSTVESFDDLMNRAHTFLELKEWGKAYETFMRCKEMRPNVKSPWLGIARAISHERTGNISRHALQQVQDCISEVVVLNNGIIDGAWIDYVREQDDALKAKQNELQHLYDRVAIEYRVATQKKADAQEAKSKSRRKVVTLFVILAIVCALPAFIFTPLFFIGSGVFGVVALIMAITTPDKKPSELTEEELGKFRIRRDTYLTAAADWGVTLKESRHLRFDE